MTTSAAVSKQTEFIVTAPPLAVSKQVEYIALGVPVSVSKQVEYIILSSVAPPSTGHGLLNIYCGM